MGIWSDPENKKHVNKNNIYEQVVKALAKDERADYDVLLDFIKEIEGKTLTDKEIINLYFEEDI